MPQTIFPPSPIILEFYYHFSTLTLVLSWIITPLLFYVILTQSKNLNTFKWLILNHSFWCFALETAIGLIKPLIFLPSFGGFPLGVLRNNSNFAITALVALFGIVSAANCIIGLTATILSRYMLVFPSKLTKWFSFKVTAIFILSFTTAFYIICVLQFLPYLSTKAAQFRDLAVAYDPYFVNYFHEPAFLFLPKLYGSKMSLCVFLSIIALIFAAFLLMALFFYLITKFRHMTPTKLQRSLIISSIMQIFFTNLFLFLPLAIIMGTITFETPNSSTLSCICFCLLSTHSLVEFVVTLYFVSPYRNFILRCFAKFPPHKECPMKTVQVSFVSSSLQHRRFTK